LTKNPHLEGRVMVQFMITEMGTVSKSIVQENDTKDRDVGACIAEAVERWKFPRGGSGGIALVSYPFKLTQG
jgi:TonB family protein